MSIMDYQVISSLFFTKSAPSSLDTLGNITESEAQQMLPKRSLKGWGLRLGTVAHKRLQNQELNYNRICGAHTKLQNQELK